MNDLVKVSIDQGWDEEEPTKLPIGTLSMALQKEKNIKFNQLQLNRQTLICFMYQ